MNTPITNFRYSTNFETSNINIVDNINIIHNSSNLNICPDITSKKIRKNESKKEKKLLYLSYIYNTTKNDNMTRLFD